VKITGGLRTEMLDFSLQQWAALQNLGLQLLPFLAHPHLHRRLRRVDNVSFQRRMDFGKSIPAAAMIAKSTVRMKDRLAAVNTLPHQFGAAPDTKMLMLRCEGEIATLGAYSILVGRHWSSYKGVASSVAPDVNGEGSCFVAPDTTRTSSATDHEWPGGTRALCPCSCPRPYSPSN